MQIKLDTKILVFILIFYITHQIKIYALLMIFACLHELGHMVTGTILGFKIDTFEIKPVGFSIILNNPIDDYNKKILNGNVLELKKILVYFTGPLINIIIALVMYFMDICVELVYINLIIAFVNFIPAYPLDGGRILKSLLHIIFGLKKSYELTEKISLAVTFLILAIGSIVVLKVQNYGLLIMIIYLSIINISENRKVQKTLELYKLINKEQ